MFATMKIAAYRKKHGLSQADFASMLTMAGSSATQSLVSQWENDDVRPPPKRWAAIERVTGRQVTREDLRPDIFRSAPKRKAA